MELNVNSPAYYKDHYGIDDEVYSFFQKAYLFFLNKEYSDTLKTVGIVPIVAPKELCDSGYWKESVQTIDGNRCAIFFLQINFEEYHSADSKKKIQLTKELILKGLRRIKSKVGFDYEAFEQDLNQLSSK